MTTRTRFTILASLIVVAALAGAVMAGPDDPDDLAHPVRVALNGARMDAGLIRSTVVYDHAAKRWRIDTDPSERLRQAEADALCAAVVAQPTRRPRLSLVDALAVLAVDPQDAQARAVVEQHVARLRAR